MKPFDLAIATAHYAGPYGNADGKDRLRYFEAMLRSAREVNWPIDKKIIWVISDDASPFRLLTIPLLRIPVEFHVNPLRIGSKENIMHVIDRGVELADRVLYCDNDGEFSHNCFERLFRMIEDVPDAQGYMVFNTNYHETIGWTKGHLLKRSYTEHGICFRSTQWSHMGREPDIFACLRSEPPYPCLTPSGLQHIGKRGLNGTEDDFDLEFTKED